MRAALKYKISAFATAAALLACLCLAGCGGVDATEATASLAEQLDCVTSADSAETQALLQGIDFYPQDYGISYGCFASTYFAKFSYEIGEADQELSSEDEIYLPLTVETYDFEPVRSCMLAAADAAEAAGVDVTQEGYADEHFDQLADPQSWQRLSLSCTIVMQRSDDGTWSNTTQQTMAALLLGGYDPSQAQ